MVVWLIGISGSGEAIIGNLIFKTLKETRNDWVLLDGDLREVGR